VQFFYIIFAVLQNTYCRLSTVAVNHHTKFQANISVHDWIIITFLKFKMTTVRYLGFLKTWFLSTRSPWAADFPFRCQICWKNIDRRRYYGPKSKSKIAAISHLGFVTSSYRTTHEVFTLGHVGLSNFMLIRCIVLQIWWFEFFLQIWLEMPIQYSRPQNFDFGGSEPRNVIGHHRDPEKAHPWLEPHLHANFGDCLFYFCSTCADAWSRNKINGC